jgi:hypothetical protein
MITVKFKDSKDANSAIEGYNKKGLEFNILDNGNITLLENITLSEVKEQEHKCSDYYEYSYYVEYFNIETQKKSKLYIDYGRTESVVIDPSEEILPRVKLQDMIHSKRLQIESLQRSLDKSIRELESIDQFGDIEDIGRKGDVVEVYKGRKIPKGTIGTVFWSQCGQYGTKLGLRTSEEKDESGKWKDVVFVALNNCKRINVRPDTYVKISNKLQREWCLYD